jgi:hypothetical protein
VRDSNQVAPLPHSYMSTTSIYSSLPLTDIDVNINHLLVNDCEFKKMAEELTELRYGAHSVI